MFHSQVFYSLQSTLMLWLVLNFPLFKCSKIQDTLTVRERLWHKLIQLISSLQQLVQEISRVNLQSISSSSPQKVLHLILFLITVPPETQTDIWFPTIWITVYFHLVIVVLTMLKQMMRESFRPCALLPPTPHSFILCSTPKIMITSNYNGIYLAHEILKL